MFDTYEGTAWEIHFEKKILIVKTFLGPIGEGPIVDEERRSDKSVTSKGRKYRNSIYFFHMSFNAVERIDA